ncbi:meiosis-specific kinetochore protein [Crotalus tigris]|uniref:meiosis-specific kinetochore protein n=1 Tax=Crotalus tigris TaxID=88082 RepID=UPI00192F1EA0|nr:meiosis-specific kinetochore protein [Crotalus tigris]XP_039180899.1 meiosis-specific kinetochore protein [Crotalus tigris]
MDWMKLRSYSQKRQTQKRTHCASPLPAKTASVAMVGMKSKAKASREHPDQLSKFNCDPQVKSTVGKKKGQMKSTVTKALPKIQEHSQVTQMVCPSSEENIELNCNEYSSTEVTNDISDMKTTPLKDSLHLASAGTQSLRYGEATSEMTLPTGVSDFLLDCLDMETTPDCSYTKSIDSTSSYSSPEIFRDETGLEDTASPETHLACKNSTLLDTSKAINIDKMSQLPNLSKILGTPLGIQGQNIARKQSRQKLTSEPTNTSAMVAGKQVYKILPANEKRLKSQPSGVSLLLPEQKNKIEHQQPVKRKCRKKITFKDVSSLSSPRVSPSSGKNSSKEMCGIVPSKLSEADMLDSLSTHEASVRDTKNPNVNSEAIVPLSPQRTIYQHLHSPPEICCIIQASPGFRPLKVLQHPTNRKKGFIPPEATEDIITSSENWTCGNGS